MTAWLALTEPAPNEHPDICTECGGECCKQDPGLCHPADFKDLEAALRSGDYQIDWWDGDPRIYYMRSTVRNAIGSLFHGAWGGKCALLTDGGCRLAWSDRPFACRALVPSANRLMRPCRTAEGLDGLGLKERLVDAWRPMQKALLAAAARIKPDIDPEEVQVDPAPDDIGRYCGR